MAIQAFCITCGDEHPGSWTGECADCEQSALALWLKSQDSTTRSETKIVCAKCGREVRPEATECWNCGNKLVPESARPRGVRFAPATSSENAAAEAVGEVVRATQKFPQWPTDPLHALAVLQEEVGELTKEALQLTYEPHKSSLGAVRTEAIQTAAMALRFLMSLDRYQFLEGQQHSQNDPSSATAAGGQAS